LVTALVLLAEVRAGEGAVQEIEASATYHLGDNDSKLDGHRLALMQAKRTALEKAGTYVESISEVKDFELTRDEVRTYSAGILAVEETKEPKWKMVGRNLEVTVYVKVQVDKDDVAKRIAKLRGDQDATRALKEERKKAQENERKIAELNRQLKNAKKDSPEAQKAQEARSELLDTFDESFFRSNAEIAMRFGERSYDEAKVYAKRSVPAVKACYRSTFTEQAAAGDRDHFALVIAAPALALALTRWRRRRTDRPLTRSYTRREMR
jgi:hypothetical protein